jgi:hypothetical protein
MNVPDAQAHVDVAATAERVFALVTDLAGLAGVSQEYSGGRWLGTASVARVGARFRGSNRRGVRLWTTVATVTDAGPERFAFDVSSLGIPVSRWQYDVEPTGEGCRVTESTWDRRPAWFRPVTVLATGVRNRPEENQRNIERTLARLKHAAEQP